MSFKRLLLFTLLVTCMLAVSATLLAQTTVSQGSIQGTITDPSGAVVGGAKITITNRATGQVVDQTSTGSGTFNSGGLLSGTYVLRVEAKGFRTVAKYVTIQVGVTASGNIKLEVGEASQVVEVQASSVQVNTEQATVQGVLTANQIDRLPVDGRNFLDLAQLEPGVQIQDGQDFDPTKAGYSSISINGVFGRTPRIELDGIDISDETVGTTTQNIALSSISEFNISRSGLDLSTELTSAGSVNVSTRSGTNDIHGQAFYNFRGRDAGVASFPGAGVGYYQRNNFGGRVGGPIIKDKLFFFADGERMKQDGLDPVVVPAPFANLTGGFNSPFRDTELTGKLDWQATKDIHVFYRFTYNWNKSESNFGYDYQVYANRDNTPSHAAGVDWNRGSWSHSIRFGYLKFHNFIADATIGNAGIFNPLPNANIAFLDNGVSLSGPNLLAPQGTFQTNKQLKYDGSKVWGSHIFRYGVGFNRIGGGGFASFFGTAPQDLSVSSLCATGDPTSCPLLLSVLGNGQGFFTEKSAFGFPGGGQDDWRFQWYIGDSWKLKPNFTLTYGLRYNRDTGRSDSDLAPIPCSVVTVTPAPCSGSSLLVAQFGVPNAALFPNATGIPGLGAQIRNPNTNFGPQLGFAWDPKGNGKTVFRGGAGIYYENYIFNNTLFDRPAKLAKGNFFGDTLLNCLSDNGTPGSVSVAIPGKTLTSIDGKDLASQVCLQPLSVAATPVADLQAAYQAATAAAGPAANGNFVGNDLTFNTHIVGAAFAPNFRTARSYQFNIGMQHEFWKGGVLTADYLRNVSTHFQEGIDVNHVGDARFLNVTAATNAITNTNAAFKCGPGQAGIDCAIKAGATINDYANNGLDSGLAYSASFGFPGAPASVFGTTPDNWAAFAGANPAMGVGEFNFPLGRSVYNGLQMSYKQQVANPVRGLTSMDLTIAYTLSRFVTTGGNDQNFSPLAWDFNNPTAFSGPASLDKKNQFKFGLTVDVAHHGPRFSVIGNFASAAPTTLLLFEDSGSTTPGAIFRSDLTGDGTVQDIFPANNSAAAGQPGQFMRSVSPSGLINAVNNWNSTQAGTLTPAGLAVVNAGLFTTAQMQELGGVKQQITPPPPDQVGNGIFREVSMVMAWPIKLTERFSLEPSFSAFNVFNLANFGRENGFLSGAEGNVNGTGNSAPPGVSPPRESLRTGTGSGIFSLGAPRQCEWGIRLNF